MLVDGHWTEAWQPVQGIDAQGGFVRKDAAFRNWVTPDGSSGPTGNGDFRAEPGRYHLYVALTCPWASRTLMARRLKRLEQVVEVSVVEPELSNEGWCFAPGADVLHGATYMHQIYTRAEPHITGRATVPVLWDRQRNTIVSNESADIVRMFDSGFGTLANGPELYPADLRAEIDALNDALYAGLNNGVYRAGFATTQGAYEQAFRDVFATLDRFDARLSHGGPFLFGSRLTETDLRLFVSLVRFDTAYHGLFKCNLRRIVDYPALSLYLEHVLTLPGIPDTVNLAHIRRGYYSVRHVNPTGIVPLGPDLPWIAPLPASGR